jgi:hypothetical protein
VSLRARMEKLPKDVVVYLATFLDKPSQHSLGLASLHYRRLLMGSCGGDHGWVRRAVRRSPC